MAGRQAKIITPTLLRRMLTHVRHGPLTEHAVVNQRQQYIEQGIRIGLNRVLTRIEQYDAPRTHERLLSVVGGATRLT